MTRLGRSLLVGWLAGVVAACSGSRPSPEAPSTNAAAESVDAGAADAPVADAGAMDAGALDAGAADAGPADAGVVEAGAGEVGAEDAGGPPVAMAGTVVLESRDGLTATVELEASGEQIDARQLPAEISLDATGWLTDDKGESEPISLTLKGTLKEADDEPVAFVDLESAVSWVREDDGGFGRFSHAPLTLRVSAGTIPGSPLNRVGAAFAFTRAAVDVRETVEARPPGDDDPTTPDPLPTEYEALDAFDMFQLGLIAKRYIPWKLCGQQLWAGVGIGAGAAAFNRVRIRLADGDARRDCPSCRVDVPASTEMYVTLPLELVITDRSVGGPHLGITPTLYSSKLGNIVLFLPFAFGWEF